MRPVRIWRNISSRRWKGILNILFTGGAAAGNEMHRLRSVGALETFEKYFGDPGQSAEELAVTEEPVRLEFGDIHLTVFPGYTTREETGAKAEEELKSGDYDFALSMFSMYSMVNVLKKRRRKTGGCRLLQYDEQGSVRRRDTLLCCG